MARKKSIHPTERELEILRVLWQRGPSTVREVNEALSIKGAIGYTTTLKFMQIMTEKGLLQRDESDRRHIYRAKAGEEKTQRQLVSDLIEKAFGGSARKLVMQAISGRKLTKKELAEIKKMLDEMGGK